MEHLWKALAAFATIWAVIATTLRVAANRELTTSRELKDDIWPAVKENTTAIHSVQVSEAACRSEIKARITGMANDIKAIKDKIFNGD